MGLVQVFRTKPTQRSVLKAHTDTSRFVVLHYISVHPWENAQFTMQ